MEPGFSEVVIITRVCGEETFLLLSAFMLQTQVPCGTGERRQPETWEEGGQLVGREEQRTRKSLVGRRTRQEEWGTCQKVHWSEKAASTYYLNMHRCIVYHTVGAVTNRHQLHSPGILMVPCGLLFLSPDLGQIPVWHLCFVFWPSPTWS